MTVVSPAFPLIIMNNDGYEKFIILPEQINTRFTSNFSNKLNLVKISCYGNDSMFEVPAIQLWSWIILGKCRKF